MKEFIEGVQWFFINYSLPTLVLVAAIALLLYLIYRNSGADTLKTINALIVSISGQVVSLSGQVAQLQTELASANEKLQSQSQEIAELKSQVKELVALLKTRDEEIADLKDDSPNEEEALK